MLLTYLIYTQYAYTPKKPVALYFMWPPSAYTIQVHVHVSKLSFFCCLTYIISACMSCQVMVWIGSFMTLKNVPKQTRYKAPLEMQGQKCTL